MLKWERPANSSLIISIMPSSEILQRIERLVAEYTTLVQSVESESCEHGTDGRRRYGDEYRACCGVIYEYVNDLACRDALLVFIQQLPQEEAAKLQERLEALDGRLKQLLTDDQFILDPKVQSKYSRATQWWYYGLPRGIAR